MKIITYKMAEMSALFPPNTAGHDMITKIPVFRRSVKVKDVRNYLNSHIKDYDSLSYLYIIDKNAVLKGVISIKEFLKADLEWNMEKTMKKHLIAANPMDSVPQVASLALKNNIKMIPIVDHENRLVGAFSADQLFDILNKEFSDDLLRLSGIRIPRKHYKFQGWKIVFSRLPWMLIGMLGGLLTGTIIGAFKSSIEAIVLLAVFIPVIMSSGATSANQSAMIFLRNLIHKDIDNRFIYIINEIKIDSALALILGLVLFPILAIYPGDIILAFAVTISLVLTIIVGGVIGVMVPMILNRFKIDPSTGAGPFLTIIKDLLAMSIYFSIATILLTMFR